MYPRDYRGSESTHAFLFQDPSIPLRIADSFLSQEYEFIFNHFVSLTDSITRFEDKYLIEGYLGKGSYGEVKLCKDRLTGIAYAVKIIDLKKSQRRVCFFN